MKRIMLKLGFCFTSFGGGMVWGIVAEASEMGYQLSGIFVG